MTSMLRPDKNFVLCRDGDPADHSTDRSFGVLKDVGFMHKDGKNTFYARMEDGDALVFSLDEDDPGAPEIGCDPSEIIRRHHLSIDSDLALMKVEQGNATNIAAVKSFYCRWKRYFAVTETSTCVVLPVKKKR